MGIIREIYALEDRFTSTFSRYLSSAQRASQASTGARQAADGLARSQQAAGAATQNAAAPLEQYRSIAASMERQLIRLNATFDAQMLAQQRMIAAGNQNTAAFAELDSRMESTGNRIRTVTAEYNALRSQMESMSSSANQAAQAQENVNQRMQSGVKTSDALTRGIKSLIGAYAGFQGIKAVIGLSDEYANTTARINLMTGSLEKTRQVQEEIYQAAMRSRSSYQATANLVANLGTMAGDAFSGTSELVAFAEQLNKQLIIAGANTTQAKSAIYQLTQGLSLGVLQGNDLRIILQQVPSLAQTIATELGVSVGKLREMASAGELTSSVIINALLGAAEETNKRFAMMPATFGQVAVQVMNIMLHAFQPILEVIGSFAQFIEPHIDTVTSLFYGLAAAVAFYTVAQWIATGAAAAFFATLAAHPVLLAIAVAIGVIVYAISQWVQSVGGIRVAWLIMVNTVLTYWGYFQETFFRGVYAVMNFCDAMGLKFAEAGVTVSNAVIQMRANVLSNIQHMVNGAIDMINWFINQLNKIPGVSIQAFEKVTFGAEAQAEAQLLKDQNEAYLNRIRGENAQKAADRAQSLADLIAKNESERQSRLDEIAQLQSDLANASTGGYDLSGYGGYALDDIAKNTGTTADNTSALKKAVDMTEEDLKMLVDMAERQYVAQVNLTAQSPVINITGQNTGNTADDRAAMADAIKRVLLEQRASGTYRAYARV